MSLQSLLQVQQGQFLTLAAGNTLLASLSSSCLIKTVEEVETNDTFNVSSAACFSMCQRLEMSDLSSKNALRCLACSAITVST